MQYPLQFDLQFSPYKGQKSTTTAIVTNRYADIIMFIEPILLMCIVNIIIGNPNKHKENFC